MTLNNSAYSCDAISLDKPLQVTTEAAFMPTLLNELR
jgi:hypothetical protein